MKSAFSTLGCPNWSFSEITSAAKDLGLDGIEIRGMGSRMYAPGLSIFSEENIAGTLGTMKRLNLEFSMLTSGCDLSDDDWDKNLKEATDYIKLAGKIGCSYVRIMCENTPDQKREIYIDEIASRYAKICALAEGSGVFPLIETNSVLANSDNMLRFLDKVNMDNAYVLWDIHHPYRFYGETPECTFSKLKGLVKYVHVKDSVLQEGKTQYKMVGYGDIPIFDSLMLLSSETDDFWASLEWTLRWNPDLQDSGIVIPHYAEYIHDLQAKLAKVN